MKNPFEGLFSKKYPERAQKSGSRMKKVYAGPPRDDLTGEDDNVFEDVYMGPPEDEPKEDPDPKQKGSPQDPMIMAVYAGPEQMSGPEGLKYIEPQMLMAYAGPQQIGPKMGGFHGFRPGGFMSGPLETEIPYQSASDTDGLLVYKRCPTCGNKCTENALFCPECGFSLKDVPVTRDENGDDGKEQDSAEKEEQEKES